MFGLHSRKMSMSEDSSIATWNSMSLDFISLFDLSIGPCITWLKSPM